MNQDNGEWGNLRNRLAANRGRLKLIGILVLLLIIIIVGFQNRDEVTTRILFFTVTMPRFVLLVLTALLGFIIGVLFSLHFLGNSKRGRKEAKGSG